MMEQNGIKVGFIGLVEDEYRPRISRVVKRLEFGSPAFELLREVTERVEPHFVSVAAFNAAFTGGDATIHQFFGAAVARVETEKKWHVVRELVLGSYPQSALSAEEHLAQVSKSRGETWSGFVDRYQTLVTKTTASRETQVKALFKKLPAGMKRLMLHLSPRSTVDDMCTMIRNASFWESGLQPRTEVEDDAMDIDLVTAQTNMATDGRVVHVDGTINFGAITNAGRVMVGAREICKTSNREAMNMLKFLQRICGDSERQRRPQFMQRRGDGRRAFVAGNPTPERENMEKICETLSEGEEAASGSETLLANTTKTTAARGQRRVMKSGLVSQSHLGYPRKVDALVDTGGETSIVSLALAKELGTMSQQSASFSSAAFAC